MISEKDFESTIESVLLAGGVDARPTGIAEGSFSGPFLPGGFRKRKPEDYDRARCLIGEDLLNFLRVSQPKEYGNLLKSQGQAAGEQLLERVCAEISSRGTLDVLRKGIKHLGSKFEL
jgi:type I restriction enzyme, R subunit